MSAAKSTEPGTLDRMMPPESVSCWRKILAERAWPEAERFIKFSSFRDDDDPAGCQCSQCRLTEALLRAELQAAQDTANIMDDIESRR